MKVWKKIQFGISHYLKTTDKWLLLLCMLLSTISVVFLIGIEAAGFSNPQMAVTQMIASIIGVMAAIVVSLLDYRTLAKLWKLYLPICVIGILLTFVLGVERGSNKAWLAINLFGKKLSLQPAEFLKIAFILTFSLHLNEVKDHINRIGTVALLCLHGAAYCGLIVLQNDSGTALVFFGMFLIMIFMAGISWKYIVAALALLVPAVPILWFFVMSGDQKMRFLVMKDPTISDRYAYHQREGLKALGYGGITGVGFSGQHVYVPESYNDFIFTFIGQVTGLIGLIGIMVLLLILIGKLLHNATTSRDMLGRSICIGVMAMILIQSIMNIGMCINIMPVIGVTLPFLSAGGTSVVSMYLGIGLVLSTYRCRKKDTFSPEDY